MNKQIQFLQRINFVPKYPAMPKYDEKSDDVRPQFEELLDLIYSIDPRTGMPKGDLAVFMNGEANPEIRDFIQKNLLMEMPTVEGSGLVMSDSLRNSFTKNITDDDIAEFSRNANETSEEYAKRLSDKCHDLRLNYQRERETKRLQAKLRSKSKLVD